MAVNAAPFCPRRDGSGFAVAYHGFGRVDFYDSTAAKTFSARVPYPSQAQFRMDSVSKRIRFRKPRNHYMGACEFSGHHLFALYSGRRASAYENEGYAMVEANFVHVFDLNGNLVKVLDLGVGVVSITLDRPGRTLYAASWSDAVVYRFAVPPL
jgi:hypothetical protein